MKTPKLQKPEPAAFLAEARQLAEKFGWPGREIERPSEAVLVASTVADVGFERFVWVYNTRRIMLRCLLVGAVKVPVRRQNAIFKLCALINEGLPFGCLEYSSEEHVLVFRDSADLTWGPLAQVVFDVTERTLNLGRRYAPAIADVLDGTEPEEAVKQLDSNQ